MTLRIDDKKYKDTISVMRKDINVIPLLNLSHHVDRFKTIEECIANPIKDLINYPEDRYPNNIYYLNLLNSFNGYYYDRLFVSAGVERHLISISNGVIRFKINRESKWQLLATVCVRKEFIIPAIQNIINNDFKSIDDKYLCLIYNKEFDHKDFPYKGLRASYRKNILSKFKENNLPIIPVGDMINDFEFKIQFPKFKTIDQKKEWDSKLVDYCK